VRVGHNIILDMAICIVMAWIMAVLAQVLRQPLILAYLVAGFAVGPQAAGWVAEGSIKPISELGLILLLFMIGLEIDLKKIIGAGKLITVTGTIQIIGGTVLGLFFFWVFFPMGYGRLDALYLAVAAALSSTVIIVKILYDKRELDGLPGRITLGILVLQDIFAILCLAVQPNLNEPGVFVIVKSLLMVVVLVVVSFVISRFALPPVFRAVARLPELVLVGALAWCFLMAGLADGVGLSKEMGALVAGVAISTFPYTLDVVARVTSLRDFFLTLFFVTLGMSIPAPTPKLLPMMLTFCFVLLLTRALTVFLPLQWMSQGHRTSLLPAINLSQISEFSLVIIALGLKSGHISQDTYAVVSYSFVLLAVLSTYAMTHSDKLVKRLSLHLSDVNIRDLDEQTIFLTRPKNEPRIFLLGFAWTASSLLEEITRYHPGMLPEISVIDFNPQVHRELLARGINVKYGDVSQRDTLLHAGVDKADIVVCSLPNTVLKGTNNLKLLQQLREMNPKAQIVMEAELLSDIPKLYEAGASYVSVPRLLEANDLRNVLEAARNKLLEEKRAELDVRLVGRNEVIP
jgi:Kef-type K+ transport system membrane component KefB